MCCFSTTGLLLLPINQILQATSWTILHEQTDFEWGCPSACCEYIHWRTLVVDVTDDVGMCQSSQDSIFTFSVRLASLFPQFDHLTGEDLRFYQCDTCERLPLGLLVGRSAVGLL